VTTPKTITIPEWVTGLGKYVGIVAPLIFGFWLKVHDMEQDFAKHQTVYEARVETLLEKSQGRDVLQERTAGDLKYIRETMDRIEKTMERLATQ
jgi:hypothetical protein